MKEENISIKKTGKTYILGDIHGNLKALKQCLERAGVNKEVDIVIQLGDVADGYPDVKECIDELLSIKNLISIRGNHDVWTMNWFNSGEAPELWVTQGGKSTLASFQNQPVNGIYKDFFNKQRDFYLSLDNDLFVHAGFDLTLGFEESITTNVGIPNATELHWSRDLAQFNTKTTPTFYYKELDQFKEIYIGHTAHNTIKFNYPEKRNIWNLDTGAGHGGKLTIMDIDTKEYWQSDPATILYPGYKPR